MFYSSTRWNVLISMLPESNVPVLIYDVITIMKHYNTSDLWTKTILTWHCANANYETYLFLYKRLSTYPFLTGSELTSLYILHTGVYWNPMYTFPYFDVKITNLSFSFLSIHYPSSHWNDFSSFQHLLFIYRKLLEQTKMGQYPLKRIGPYNTLLYSLHPCDYGSQGCYP